MTVSNARSLFRTSAVSSGLMTKEQLDAAIDVVKRSSSAPAPFVEVKDEQLAESLVAKGVISQYQADQLLQGRTRFHLGAYVITDFIGQGGMGWVYKAKHNLMGREVAVKVLPLPRSTPEAEANFQREIRLQAQLDHPNLVRAYDAGHDGKVYYLVVEYVPGTDLRRLVRTEGKLDIHQAATVVMQAAMGLDHAHSRGLIHRDVKPGNLLVTPDGHTKVSDLGLAGFVGEGEADPRAGKIVGTADYIAPEVFRSPLNVSPVSDIYSLGCTLYYAVTGKVPFPGGSTREKLERHLNDTPFHPGRFNESVTEEFVEIVADMMEKDPAKRTQTAAEIVARLAPWAKEEGPLPSSERASRWSPPPLPATQLGSEDSGEHEVPLPDNVGTAAQRTIALSSPSEETHPLPEALLADRRSHGGSLASLRWAVIALAISVPISMCVGALLMFALLQLIK